MISKRFQIDEENSNNRVDIFLANNLDAISRGIVQQLISEGKVTINGKETKRNYLLKPSDICLLYTSPSPRDLSTSRMPSSA